MYLLSTFLKFLSNALIVNLNQQKCLQRFHGMPLRSIENLVVPQDSHFPEVGLEVLITKYC